MRIMCIHEEQCFLLLFIVVVFSPFFSRTLSDHGIKKLLPDSFTIALWLQYLQLSSECLWPHS